MGYTLRLLSKKALEYSCVICVSHFLVGIINPKVIELHIIFVIRILTTLQLCSYEFPLFVQR